MPYTPQQLKGHRAERRARDELIKLGFTVIKAGGSKGIFDLVAWNDADVMLIQVKCNRLPAKAERERMLGCPRPPNAKLFAAIQYDYARKITWKEITCEQKTQPSG